MNWSWETAAEILPLLAKGLRVTLIATAGGMGLALVLGLIWAMLRRSRIKAIAWPVSAIVEFIRNTPLLIQLFFVYFLIPDYGWNTALLTGIVILGLHYSTYTSEVYRSGIDGVPRGQWEAATALNLSTSQRWTRVVLPQAFPPILPAMGNYLIAMFKDTPLLFAITVQEMFYQADSYASFNGTYVEPYTLAAVIFLLLSLISAGVIRLTERVLIVRGN